MVFVRGSGVDRFGILEARMSPDPSALDRPRPLWHDALLVAAVLALGVAATVVVHGSLREADAHRLQLRSTAASNEVLGRVELTLTRTVEAVRSAALMVETQAALPRAAFMRYAQQLAGALPAVAMLEWQPVVPGPQRDAFERKAREQGLPYFALKEPSDDGLAWQPAPERERYVPILYGWPEGQSPLGYNLAPDPVRMASKDEAARLGRPVASGSFSILGQNIGAHPVRGFAISAPVMEATPSPSGTASARGFLAAVVALPELFAPVTTQAQNAALDLWVYEGSAAQGKLLLRSAQAPARPAPSGQAAALQRVATVDVAGQAWTLVLQPQAALLSEGRHALTSAVLALGLLATLLLSGAVLRALRERRHAQAARAKLAMEQQRLTEVIDVTRAAVWEHDFVTGRSTANARWETMAGYAPGEHALQPGYDWHEDCHPEDVPRVEESLRRHFAGETESYEIDYRHRRKDGGWLWVHTRAKVLARDAQGRPLRVAGTALDIQPQKEAEARILELNAALEARVEERSAQLATALASLEDSREELARAEGRATIDTLVANVTQELASPLGNGVIAAQNLADRSREFQRRLSDGPLRRSELQDYMSQVVDNAELAQRNLARAAQLLDTFRQFGSDPVGEPRREIDLAEWLQALQATLANSPRVRPHTLRLDVPDGLRLDTLTGPLSQVLIQLLQHLAQHAFAPGQSGQLTLAAHSADGHLHLALGDDGAGLPPSALSGLFAPLLRHSAAQAGAHLGMAIVDRLVRKDLGGSIRVVGLPGPGVRFELRLPLQAPVKGPVAPPATPARP